jgi:Lrp/AsnC family transcriptional regulator for asnA, asnC and gidA
MDSKMRDHVIEELMKINEVREISEVTGRFDIIVTMYAKNLDEMHRLISENVGRIQGVQRSESFIEMKRTTKAMPYKQMK